MKLNLEGLTQEQLNSIKKQIEEFEKKNEKPKDKIDYENGWVVNGDRIQKTFQISTYQIDDIYSIGLYRDTKEECEKLFKKMKIEHRLRQWAKLCKEEVDLGDKDQKKYYIHMFNDIIEIGYVNTARSNNIYFTDRLILEKAIADIGKQKLIDEYFVEV